MQVYNAWQGMWSVCVDGSERKCGMSLLQESGRAEGGHFENATAWLGARNTLTGEGCRVSKPEKNLALDHSDRQIFENFWHFHAQANF